MYRKVYQKNKTELDLKYKLNPNFFYFLGTTEIQLEKASYSTLIYLSSIMNKLTIAELTNPEIRKTILLIAFGHQISLSYKLEYPKNK